MSYFVEKREDFLNEYFSRLADFYKILPNLENAKTKSAFLIWFEKLALIDRRSLYLYLKKNYSKFPPSYLKQVKSYFGYQFLPGKE